MRFEPDNWLTKVLGWEVFRLFVALGEESAVRDTLAEQFCGRAVFFYARIPTVQIELARELARIGFFVVDVSVKFERECADKEEGTSDQFVVRDVRPQDAEALLRVADSCFAYSRFHLDPLFTKAMADKVKQEWMRSYLSKQRGMRLLVADFQDKLVGFLCILEQVVRDRRLWVIDLIGVANSYQGRGIGRTLVQFFVREAVGKCDQLVVSTQIANIPALRLYERCGFLMRESEYVLHAHMRDHAVAKR